MASLKSRTSLTELALSAAKNFRLGYEGASNALLVEFIDGFARSLEKHQLTHSQHLTNLLTSTLEAQERRDLLFVADTIQYELLPLIIGNTD